MVSFAHLLTLLSVLVSLAVAEEAGAAKTGAVEEKWIGLGAGVGFGGGMYTSGYYYPRYANWLGSWGPFAACGVWPYYPRYRYWFKEAGNSVSRRSELQPFNSDHLYPRGQQETVNCKGKDGTVQEINASHCQKAIDNLISQKSSSASFATCSVSMATPNGKLEVNGAPAEALHTAASEILKACSTGTGEGSSAAPQKVSRRSPAEAPQKSNQQFAMIISKNVAGNGN
ncbi:hypothetical protein PCANC_03812 [Puccinia coronata f. sp. avenae]|uniref:Uncharacterized protein n=1 Tax=Puccinia coronata f. sp. avenae TaxID=200324 RepID=A0A2N5T7E3_9BASI|nr:hypothetical protein PCANC_03812 [Puccinia coronata f. sp. avenae]PLW23087.1 hypothetical protein PCASD_10512 [Puccinia coronata f. sp. avenae]PLW50703.1 hypothetical protein PCASD_00732 [Puccinia coronata f. sp. avenae]